MNVDMPSNKETKPVINEIVRQTCLFNLGMVTNQEEKLQFQSSLLCKNIGLVLHPATVGRVLSKLAEYN